MTEREHQRQTDAERNAHTIPVNAESTDGKGHAVELKAQAKARELYQICHSASSSSSASGAVPSGWIYMTAMRSVLRMCCSAASASSAVRPASMAGEGKICHLTGRILHIFEVFDQLAVFFVLAQGKDLPVHAFCADAGDLVQQQLPHGVRLVALAGEQDAAAAVHPQHLPAKARVHKTFVVQAAVQR